MPIGYRGKVQSLQRELAEARPRLEERYHKVLGGQNAEKLLRVFNKVFEDGSFFDSPTAMNERLGTKFTDSTPNKFLFMAHDADLKLFWDGAPSELKIRTSAGIYTSELGLQRSDYKNILYSYVHEFNHFVWYALQKVPIYLVTNVWEKIMKPETPMSQSNTTGEWVNSLMDSAFSGPNHMQSVEAMLAAANIRAIHEHLEKSNRILDKMILKGIGVDIRLEWRHKEREVAMFQHPAAINIRFGLPIGGDPFDKYNDAEVIERVLDWENHWQANASTPKAEELLQRLKRAKILRIPFSELARDEEGGEAKAEKAEPAPE
jgi:hypothetical protein